MDRLNNNNNNENYNSFEANFDSFNMTGDDFRNHNESRNTARIIPLTYHNDGSSISTFNRQEYGRTNIDRLKDRQIAILTQKNNQLQTELLALQQKYPVLYEYSMMGHTSNNNKHLHLQIKLLTTTLNEKNEELRQIKEELRQIKKDYELVMQERKTVLRELQEQTAEIDMLKGLNSNLQDKINFTYSHGSESSNHQNGKCCLKVRDTLNENEILKTTLSDLEAIVQDLTNKNNQRCLQLNTVLDNYCNLQMTLFNKINSNKEMRSLPESNFSEIISSKIKMIDLKLMLLKIPCNKPCQMDSVTNDSECNKSINGDDVADGTNLHLKEDDNIISIEDTCVTNWSDNKILEYLTRFEASGILEVKVSRKTHIRGDFLSWKRRVDASLVKTLYLSPLWMVKKSDVSVQDLAEFKVGDILQLNNNWASTSDGIITVNITRLNPLPFVDCGTETKEHDGRNELSPHMNPKAFLLNPHNNLISMKYSDTFYENVLFDQTMFPVLPVKRRPLLFIENHSSPTQCPISDYNLSQHSNMSVSSAPPVPPRSSISLQYSLMENFDLPIAFNTDLESTKNGEFIKKNTFVNEKDKLNLSVQSAIQFDNYNNIMNSTSRELMSASFNCTSEFSSHKIPKLGKCRNVTLTVPSKIFCLKDLGLHLLHGKTEEAPVSKSDVDVSVINQIFIRNVEANSISQAAGLVEGDEIIMINNHPVSKMTAEEAENFFLTNPLKPDRQKYSLLIKAQFNPLKMYELFKEKSSYSLDPNFLSIRFTRSMYDETNSGRDFQGNGTSHRLHVIRSSSNLNISTVNSQDNMLKNGIIQHLQTHERIIRTNTYSFRKMIKIIGGSNAGIFISDVIYNDEISKNKEKESIGNRLAVGDKILESNGESFDHIIGDVAISILNNQCHQSVMKVIYDPQGLLAISSDPLCQERFYMKASFSFSELHNPLTTVSEKREKAASVCSRLDHIIVNIPFVRNYHLRFEKNDILLVDATILPSTMTRSYPDDKNSPTDWHAWVVDKNNNKISEGMIPSAFWIEKMLSMHYKSFRFPVNRTKSSMRSTPSSPISETNGFPSSPSTTFQNEKSKLFHNPHSSLGQKFFNRIYFKNHIHSKVVSNDYTNKGTSFQKFIPIKRLPKVTDSKRPVILLGPHADTIAMVVASTHPQEFILDQSSNHLDYSVKSNLHTIISVSSKDDITDLHNKHIFPIVILLNYKSAKQIRQLRICKIPQIKFSKSDCNKLFSQSKEFEANWFHLINEIIFPNDVSDTCEAIVGKVESVQKEDVWLQSDQFQYSD